MAAINSIDDTLHHAAMNEVAAALQGANPIVITAHDRPDGDALGAALGLARMLRAAGREVHLTGCQPISQRYRFMLDGDLFLDVDPVWCETGVLVTLDCGADDRTESVVRWRDAGGKVVVNIDHHHSNTFFGDTNWVDAAASSASEMVVRLGLHLDLPVPLAAAEVLWTGIVTDTGRFSYENTGTTTLLAAASLVEIGVEPGRLSEIIYENCPLVEMRLQRRALESFTSAWAGCVAWMSLDRHDFAQFASGPEDASNLAELARSLAGVRLAIFFYELPGVDETKVSLRSLAPLDCSRLAVRFGGGGHQRAAGCTLTEGIDAARTRTLAAIEEMYADDLGPRGDICHILQPDANPIERNPA